MIDLHTHILPGLDDGPASVADALAVARAAAAAGTRAVAATPHIDTRYGLDADTIAAVRRSLAADLVEFGVEIELLAGGEIAPKRLPSLDDDDLSALTLGGGGYVLLECPFVPSGVEMPLMVNDLHRRGFGVLLAHPERSPTFQHDVAFLERLVRDGALAQVTVSSLTGRFGRTAQRAAEHMLDRGLVHVLASDAHDAAGRPPDLRAADAVLDPAQREWLTEAAPAAIVAGEALPPRPLLRRRRGLLSRLRRRSAAPPHEAARRLD